MAVPSLSAAGVALGFGSSVGSANISTSLTGETEEERRKRLLAMQAQKLGLSPAGTQLGLGYSAVFGSSGGY